MKDSDKYIFRLTHPIDWWIVRRGDIETVKKVAKYVQIVEDTALGYGLDDRGSRVRFPAGAGNFSLHRRVQNGSGSHPLSYLVGTRCSFPGSKAAGA
jgi:hypothetical protein